MVREGVRAALAPAQRVRAAGGRRGRGAELEGGRPPGLSAAGHARRPTRTCSPVRPGVHEALARVLAGPVLAGGAGVVAAQGLPGPALPDGVLRRLAQRLRGLVLDGRVRGGEQAARVRRAPPRPQPGRPRGRLIIVRAPRRRRRPGRG